MTKSFHISINEYWSNMLLCEWNLIFPLSMLVLLLFFTLIISSIYLTKKDPVQDDNKMLTVQFKILSSVYWGGLLVLFISLVTLLILLKFTVFFASNFSQFGIIAGFIIICSLTFFAYLKIFNSINSRDIKILNIPISTNFSNKRVHNLRNTLNRMFYSSFLLAVPLFILAIENKNEHLVSIVLDNSGSMMESLPYGINALETAIMQSPQDAEYVLTTLTQIRNFDPKAETLNQYFDTIVSTFNMASLPTVTERFSNSIELINAFRQVSDAGASPIYHGIWQNFLMSRKVAMGNSYATKKLIIISDGVDILYQWKMEYPELKWMPRDIFQHRGMLNQAPIDFFDGGIYCINLGENDSENMYKDCANSIHIYDGTNQQSYFKALVDILPDLYFDIVLLYIVFGIVSVFLVFLLITKSSIK